MSKIDTTRRGLNARRLVQVFRDLPHGRLRNLPHYNAARNRQVLARNHRIRNINVYKVIRTSSQVITQHTVPVPIGTRRRQGHRRVNLTTGTIKRLVRHGRHNRHQVNRHFTTQRKGRTPFRVIHTLRNLTYTGRTLPTHISQQVSQVSYVKTRMRGIFIPGVSRVLHKQRRTIFVISKSHYIRTFLQ